MPDDSEEDALARDMIEVHGDEASGIARANARTAALAGAIASAKHWIRVLGVIQRRSVEKGSSIEAWSCMGGLANNSSAEGGE